MILQITKSFGFTLNTLTVDGLLLVYGVWHLKEEASRASGPVSASLNSKSGVQAGIIITKPGE